MCVNARPLPSLGGNQGFVAKTVRQVFDCVGVRLVLS